MKYVLTLIRSFFRSLQLEIERQTDHLWRQATGLPTLKRSEITPQLFLGGQYSRSGLIKLQERGITGVVNMRMSERNVPDLRHIKYLHLPTPDLQAPTLAQLQEGVTFITQEIEHQGKVYVHCAHGEGRGPTMVIAYLISTGMTLNAALDQVQKIRRFARPTQVQLSRLKEFALTTGQPHEALKVSTEH